MKYEIKRWKVECSHIKKKIKSILTFNSWQKFILSWYIYIYMIIGSCFFSSLRNEMAKDLMKMRGFNL